jgi:uncharacterized membrane protein YoaK (UPF0700 family)
MWTAIKGMLGSKKFIAAAIGVVVWLVGKLGAHLDSTELTEAITPLLAYIVGQGIADHGKEAVKLPPSP